MVTLALNELRSLFSHEKYIQLGCLDERLAVFANASSKECKCRKLYKVDCETGVFCLLGKVDVANGTKILQANKLHSVLVSQVDITALRLLQYDHLHYGLCVLSVAGSRGGVCGRARSVSSCRRLRKWCKRTSIHPFVCRQLPKCVSVHLEVLLDLQTLDISNDLYSSHMLAVTQGCVEDVICRYIYI